MAEIKGSYDLDDDGDVLTVNYTLGKITPKEIWEQKDVWFAQVNQSREEWDKMSEDQREALSRMMKGAIERMYDRIDDWLPEALSVEGGNYMDVQIKFLFTDIDKEIDRNEQATSFKIKAAAQQASEALREIEGSA